MSPLLVETIKCENGRLFNLDFHQNRFDTARQNLFGSSASIPLAASIKIPNEAEAGLFRCRVIYTNKIEKIEFLPHHYRSVKSLKLVEDNRIDYHLKYANRDYLNNLFEQREDCDDILIIKNGCVTDSSTANSIFWDGVFWWGPDTPLLNGTMRARLIEEGKIKVCRITPADFKKYAKVGLINALQDLEIMPIIDIEKVK